MENLNTFFQAIMAVCAFFALLGWLIELFLRPIKLKITKIETDINELKAGQAKLEAGQDKLNERMNGFEIALNKVLVIVDRIEKQENKTGLRKGR